jgi:hypothetical protein
VPAGVRVPLRPGHDVRHGGELVVTTGTAVRRLRSPDVADHEPVLDAVDAGRSSYLVV